MGTRPPRAHQPHPLHLDVVRIARERSIVSNRGPKAGQPSVDALRRGAGIGYATAYELLRWPNRVRRLASISSSALLFAIIVFGAPSVPYGSNAAVPSQVETTPTRPISAANLGIRPTSESVQQAALQRVGSQFGVYTGTPVVIYDAPVK